jgi:D-3-phosphoglycerate dehydrogenase
LFNKLNEADREIDPDIGTEKAIGVTNQMVKSLGLLRGNACEKLRGFDVKVLCYDIKQNVGCNAKQVLHLKYFSRR